MPTSPHTVQLCLDDHDNVGVRRVRIAHDESTYNAADHTQSSTSRQMRYRRSVAGDVSVGVATLLKQRR